MKKCYNLFKLLICFFISSIFFAPAIVNAKNNESTIIVGIESFPEVFIPSLKSGSLVFFLGAQLFCGLTRYDEQGEAVPYLAESWTVSDDNLSYIFKIKNNAFFHDGEKINADDVAFSLKLSMTHHTFSPFLESIKQVEVLDNKTIRIHLHNALPILPKLLAPIYVPILPKHVYNDEQLLQKNLTSLDIVGSGPFKLKEFTENERILLVKDSTFFLETLPKVDNLEYIVFPSNDEMYYALQLKQIDIVSFYSEDEAIEFKKRVDSNDYNFYPIKNLHPYFSLVLNFKNPILANAKVRKALSLAIDRKSLVDFYNSPNVQIMNTPIAPQSPFALDTKGIHDVKQANLLLDEAGYPRDDSGKRFELYIDCLDYPSNLRLVNWLQAEFAKTLGVELKTRNYSQATRVEANIVAGNFDLFLDEVYSYNDPLIGLHRLYSSKNINRDTIWTNNSHYINSTVDALFDKANKEADTQKRQEIYNEIQQVLIDDTASLWLINNSYLLVSGKNIKNLESLFYALNSPLLFVSKEENL